MIYQFIFKCIKHIYHIFIFLLTNFMILENISIILILSSLNNIDTFFSYVINLPSIACSGSFFLAKTTFFLYCFNLYLFTFNFFIISFNFIFFYPLFQEYTKIFLFIIFFILYYRSPIYFALYFNF